jgi:starvation-inducible DNA-binding protein
MHAMPKAHEVADKHEDVATASLLDKLVDAAEKPTSFLSEAGHLADPSGH